MSDTSSSAHSLFLQLQARYPTAALVTELVQIHQTSYIVRCLVQLNGNTLATGMAAAPTIEQAEDLARLRVFALIGIDGQVAPKLNSPAIASHTPAIPFPPGAGDRPYGQPATPPPAFTSSPPLSGNGTSRSAPIPPLPIIPAPDGEPSTPAPSMLEETSPLPLPNPPFHPEDSPLVALPDLPKRTSTPELEEEFTNLDSDRDLDADPEVTANKASGNPIDLSELIALTDVEMERIGWGKKRGQSHLKRTYGKQTRAELNEDQLLEFLHFLRALPSQAGGTEA